MMIVIAYLFVCQYICLMIVTSPAYILSCLRVDELSVASSVCLACRLCVCELMGRCFICMCFE